MKKLLLGLSLGLLVMPSIFAEPVCNFHLGVVAAFKNTYEPVYVEIFANGKRVGSVTLYGNAERAQRIFQINQCIQNGTIKFSSLDAQQNHAVFDFNVTYDKQQQPMLSSTVKACTYPVCCVSKISSAQYNFKIGDPSKCFCPK